MITIEIADEMLGYFQLLILEVRRAGESLDEAPPNRVAELCDRQDSAHWMLGITLVEILEQAGLATPSQDCDIITPKEDA